MGYYDLLQLHDKASHDDIHRNYSTLAEKFHPVCLLPPFPLAIILIY